MSTMDVVRKNVLYAIRAALQYSWQELLRVAKILMAFEAIPRLVN